MKPHGPCFGRCDAHRNLCTEEAFHPGPCRCHRLFCGWALLPESLEGAAALALLVFALLALGAVELGAEEDRAFHPLDLATLAALPPGSAAVPTHVRLTGWITYKKTERDGDVHLRMSDGDAVVVLEAIPELPEIEAKARAVRIWTKVTVWGVSRYDGAPGHGWWEVHPVLGIEAAK